MSVESELARQTFYITSDDQLLTTNIRVFDESEYLVTRRRNNVDTELVININYTVESSTFGLVGQMTADLEGINGDWLTGDTIIVSRAIANLQSSEFPYNGQLPSKTIEASYDKMAMRLQKLEATVERSLRLPIADDAQPPLALADRANRIVAFDESGDLYYSIYTGAPGTVTSVAVNGNDGITELVAEPNEDVLITLGLGDITPDSVITDGAISTINGAITALATGSASGVRLQTNGGIKAFGGFGGLGGFIDFAPNDVDDSDARIKSSSGKLELQVGQPATTLLELVDLNRIVRVLGDLNVTGDTDVQGDVTVTGDTDVQGDVTVDGRVGIGASSPNALLNLYDSTNSRIRLTGLQTGASYGIDWGLNTTDGIYAAVNFDYDDRAQKGLQINSAYNITFNDIGTDGDIDAEWMRITSGGLVGIGTSAPSHKLHVAGNIGVDGNTTLGSNNSDTVDFNARIASEFTPATDNTYDLGRTGHEWRDLYLDGTANIDSLIADTADINGGTIDGTAIGATTPAAGTFSQVNSDGAIIAVGAGSFGDDTDITGDLTVTGDAEINGLTVGRGSGNVSGNTASGYTALYSNTTGDRNTASGYRSLYSNTTGDDNAASGYAALYSNTTGNKNTALGYVALYSNTDGVNNTASGYQALYTNTTGVNNTALGMGALLNNTTGNNNAASGYLAGYDNTEGVQNTYVGYNTGRGITTGNYNTVLGANVTGLSATLSNNVIIADGQGNRRINIDGSGNVGIGLTAPTTGIDFRGTSANAASTMQIVGTGVSTLLLGQDADGGVIRGQGGSNKLTFKVGGSGDTAATTGGTTAMTIDSAGRVGVGTSAPTSKLNVASNFDKTAATSRAAITASGSYGGGVAVLDGTKDSGFFGDAFGDTMSIFVGREVDTDTPQSKVVMSLLESGRVGIGTAGPAKMLHIESTAGNQLRLAYNSSYYWDIEREAATGALTFTDSTNGEIMRIDPDGNVGIGTSSPAAPLHVFKGSVSGPTELARFQGGSGAENYRNFISLYTTNPSYWWETSLQDPSGGGTQNNLTFVENSGGTRTERMTLKSGGNVGVGTMEPASLLSLEKDSALGISLTRTGAFPSVCELENSGGYLVLSNNVSGIDFQTGATPTSKVVINSSGNLGIGNGLNPTYKLQLNTDSAAKPSTNTWTIASDARIKTETGEYTKGLDAVLSLRPVTYRYNGKAGMVDDGEDKISIIAQEAITAFPECVGSYMTKLEEDDEEETEVLNWNGHALTFALVNAIKELTARIETLENN